MPTLPSPHTIKIALLILILLTLFLGEYTYNLSKSVHSKYMSEFYDITVEQRLKYQDMISRLDAASTILFGLFLALLAIGFVYLLAVNSHY